MDPNAAVFSLVQPDRGAAEQGENRSRGVHAFWMVGGPVRSRYLLLRLCWIRLHRDDGSVLNGSQAHLAEISPAFVPRVSSSVSWDVSGVRVGE